MEAIATESLVASPFWRASVLALRRFKRPVGAWRSLASALASGARGRRFKSSRPDQFFPIAASSSLRFPSQRAFPKEALGFDPGPSPPDRRDVNKRKGTRLGKRWRVWDGLVLFSFLFACGGGGTSGSSGSQLVPKGARSFAIDVRESKNETYDQAFTLAQAMKVANVKISLDWNLIETPTGFDFTIPDIIDSYYPAKNMPVVLVFRPIDTNRNTFPSDLSSKALDDSTLISRFQAFLSAVKGRLTHTTVAHIQIGNEVDGYLGTSASQWAAWTTFFQQARSTAKALWGTSLKVGCIGQFKGLTDVSTKSFFQTLNASTDLVSINYYPLNSDFTVRPTSQISGDFQTLVDLYPGRELVFQECGFPSSSACKSDPSTQVAFIKAVFAAWDEHPKSILHIDFAWQTDVPATTVDQWVVQYGMSASPYLAAFKGYLGSLGLRDENGLAKPALATLQDQLSHRGW